MLSILINTVELFPLCLQNSPYITAALSLSGKIIIKFPCSPYAMAILYTHPSPEHSPQTLIKSQRNDFLSGI